MAATKGKDPHATASHDKKAANAHAHDDHHHADEEDVVRTPLWMPFVGIGLLMLGALFSYLFVYPGTMSTSANADAASGDASAEAAAPAAPAEAAH